MQTNMLPDKKSPSADGVRAKRPAFTLIEVVVASAIMVILAAVTIPQVMDALDKKRIEDTYDLMIELHYGFTNTVQTGFMNVVRSGASATNTSMAPGRLSELTEPIISNQAATYPNSCGGTFNATASTTWTLGGPFLERAVSTTQGLRTPIGQLQNTLVRTPASPANPAWIAMQIVSVDINDAVAFDLRVDGVAGTNAGTIQYANTSPTTVNYLIPLPNRC